MSTELAEAIFSNIGNITHLRTLEFLKAVEDSRDEKDGYSRITYAQWRDKYRLHAFILNACTEECERLGFIEVFRENKDGIAKNGGGKGTRRIYRLTLDKVGQGNEAQEKKPDPEPKLQAKNPVKKAVKKSVPKKTLSSKKKGSASANKKSTVKKAVKKVVKKKSK